MQNVMPEVAKSHSSINSDSKVIVPLLYQQVSKRGLVRITG